MDGIEFQARSRHLIQIGPSAAVGANYLVGKVLLGVSLSTDNLNVSATQTTHKNIRDFILQVFLLSSFIYL